MRATGCNVDVANEAVHAVSNKGVAIIGVGLMAPGAADPDTFLWNYLQQNRAISEIPEGYWDWRRFYSENRRDRDKCYSKWGGFTDAFPFDPIPEGIAPASMRSLSCAHIMAWEAARRALIDAGYENAEGLDRQNTSVILAMVAGFTTFNTDIIFRTHLPFILDAFDPTVLERLPKWSTDSIIGFLGSLITGRLCSRYDFGGENYILDSACASTLKTLELAVRDLETGRCNVAMVGGVDANHAPGGHMVFARSQALSPTGEVRPFDKQADGIVLSDGCVIFLMKRLEDAQAAGDRIYAVVRGTGGTSDGHGASLTTPQKEGQLRALKKAYAQAGFSPSSLDFCETHGTGTVVGDRVELDSMNTFLAEHGTTPKTCQISSVKALVGHAKAVAGAYGMVSGLMAMHHRVLPPQANLQQPLDGLLSPDSRVFVRKQATPWLRHPDHPRRAAVNAFGFGGTNVHAVLEEACSDHRSSAPGGNIWPSELFVWTASSRELLISTLQLARTRLMNPRSIVLRDVAYTCAQEVVSDWQAALAIVAGTEQELDHSLDLAIRYLDQPSQGKLPPHIHVRERTQEDPCQRGKVAFMFPGQGSQYPNMAAQSAVYLEALRGPLEMADAALQSAYGGSLLSHFIFPEGSFSPEMEQQQRTQLANTHVAQPSIGVVACGFLDLLRTLGVNPDMCAGHSYGEYVALHAAGVISRDALLGLSELRGRLMSVKPDGVAGAMAAVKADRDEVVKMLDDYSSLVLANHNSPSQIVVSGEEKEIEQLLAHLKTMDRLAKRLPVSGAFHSGLMASAQEPLASAMEPVDFAPMETPVYSNVSGDACLDPKEMKELLKRHLLSPVEFVAQVEAMYRDGARVFVEVGPGQVLSGLLRQILGDREFVVFPLDPVNAGLKGTLSALAGLFVEGVLSNINPLFEHRGAKMINWNEWQKPQEYSATTWWVDGRTLRPHQERLMKKTEPSHTVDTRSEVAKPIASSLTMPSLPEGLSSESMPPEALLQAYAQYQETMQAFLKLQEQVIHQLGSGVTSGSIDKQALPKQQATPVVETPAPDEHVNNTEQEDEGTAPSIENLVIASVSERTGYPPDMLDQNLNMEADLGIDSIKRLEILSALVKAFPQGDHAEADMDRLTRAQTLREVIDELERVFAGAKQADDTQQAPKDASLAPSSVNEQTELPVGRFMTCPVEKPLASSTSFQPGHYGIVAKETPLTKELVRLLDQKGCTVSLLPLRVTEEQLPSVVEDIEKKGPLAGLIFLGGYDATALPETVEAWHTVQQAQVFNLFLYLKVLGKGLAEQRGMVVSVSRMGGAYGRDGHVGESAPLAGAAVGMLKTLSLETPGINVRSLDVASQSDEQVASLVVDELAVPDAGVEIGYNAKGQRFEYVLDVADRHAEKTANTSFSLDPDSVMLAIGGGRGITAEAIMPLVVKGMRVILVGRHVLEKDEPPIWREAKDETAIRAALVEQNQREQQNLTPSMIEEKVRSIQRNRSILTTLAKLSSLGCQPEYHSVDMTSEQAVKSFLEQTYKTHGRIDVVVQGAGVIEDKLLADKTLASFERVFRAKVDSTFLLRRYLQAERLKALILFGSVAGRTGNRGQCDYAAANEVLNRQAFEMARVWPTTRVLCFNWGPWASTGMVSEAVRQQFEARGVYPIPTESGAAFLLDELKGGTCDVEVIAGIFLPPEQS